jgi:hypothetical protein
MSFSNVSKVAHNDLKKRLYRESSNFVPNINFFAQALHDIIYGNQATILENIIDHHHLK